MTSESRSAQTPDIKNLLEDTLSLVAKATLKLAKAFCAF